MIPSEPHLTGKRKADDSNPLLAAAKRAKKEILSSQPGKRKADYSNPLLNDAAAKRAKKEAIRPQILFQFNHGSNSRAVASTSAQDDLEVDQDVRAIEDEIDHLRRNSRAHTNTSLATNQFGSNGEPSNTSKSRGKMKITDISAPLAENETPQLKRNKEMRQAAMDAIVNERNDTRHRRKSSVNGRGKRISSSFEVSGILHQPHNSVSDTSFHKHIDVDLPDSERIRQLLIWSSLRAAATPTSSTSTPSSSSQPPLPPPPPLPPLSAEAVQALKRIQENTVKMLAEKRIDLSLYAPENDSSKMKEGNLLENEQNIRNRQWEVIYSDHIKDADAENEGWKEVGFKYKAYGEKLQASLQERAAALSNPDPPIPPISSTTAAVLSEIRHAGEIGAELDKRFKSLEFNFDQLLSFIHAARAKTYVAERFLNEKFDIISSNLKSRLNLHPPGGPSVAADSSSSSTQILTTYVTNPRSSSSGAADPLDLMRALTRVDEERPPGMVGDAAWRAAREVQRVGESGVGAVGERRLTGIPVTPKKTLGTPRRGNTPGRDR